MRKLLPLVAALACAGSAFAEDPVTYTNVSTGGISIFEPSSWLKPDGSPLDKFDPDGIYKISRQYMNTDGEKEGAELVFPGRKLYVVSGGQFLPRTKNTIMQFDRDGLVLGSKGVLRCHETGNNECKLTFRGKMTVEDGSSSAPAYVRTTKKVGYGCEYVIESDLYGTSAAYLRLELYNGDWTGWSKLTLAGDMSNFKGVIMLMHDNNAVQFENTTWVGTKVYMEAPSRLILPKSGLLYTQVQLGNAAGRNTFEFRTENGSYGRLRIKETWKSGDNVDPTVLVVPAELVANCEPTATEDGNLIYTLVESPAKLSTADYLLEVTPAADGYMLQDSSLRSVSTTDGGSCLQLVTTGPRLNYQLSRDASAAGNHGSSFKPQNANNWSQGVIMDPNLLNVVSNNMQLMTFADVTTFTGYGIRVDKGGDLAMTSSAFALDNLILNNGGAVDLFNNSTLSEATAGNGRITVITKGSFRGRANNNIQYTQAIPLVSDESATVYFSHVTVSGTANMVYDVRLTKPSPDFRGKFTINSSDQSMLTNGYMKVSFTDPLAFGGPRTAAALDELTVSDGMCLCACETATFADQSRAFKVNICARLCVEPEKTLTFTQPIRWAGILKKEGAGTFARGGVHQVTAVTSTSNAFDVCEGAVKPFVTNAFDGVKMIFRGGKLLIPHAEDSDPFSAYGLVTTKLDEPFAAEDDAAIPVSFELPAGGMPAEGQTYAICTVKSAVTATALANGGMVAAMPGYSVGFSTSETEAGHTVYATLRRRGAMVFLR